jgi:cytochrome c553
MKVDISLRLVLQTAILAIVFAAAGRAEDAHMAAFSRRHIQHKVQRVDTLQAKIQYCKNCHGSAGQGYHGFLLMPRLAGQTTEYFENQLRSFIELKREKALFLNMARTHGVSPSLQTALAAHFRDLNPRPFAGAPRHLVATGKKIYEEGVPEANIPACSACHGPDAKGEGINPRLAGQLYPYTIKELRYWDRERKTETSAIMVPIAHTLTQSQITAIAAYLSYLE